MPVPIHVNPLIAAISDDHQKMCEYYDQYVRSTGDADAQGRWARKFIWQVAQHIVGEELVVHPLMERYLEVPGKKLADEDREVHEKVKQSLHDIESINPGSEEHVAKLKSVMEDLRRHNNLEVQRDLPFLTREMGEAASVRAAASFRWKEKFAPTRTHPQTATSFLQTSIDYIKDRFANFPTDSELYSLRHKNALIDAIADDHREISSYYHQYRDLNPNNVDAQRRWARQLIWDVARHIVGEELVVHPLIVTHLGDPGKELVKEAHEVHETIRELLYDIESHNPDSQEHVAILESVMGDLVPHSDNEVQRDLPLLVKVLGTANSDRAAASFQKTKKFAPTRADPHRHLPLPFETPTALMQAPIAQLQDYFRKFPVTQQKQEVTD